MHYSFTVVSLIISIIKLIYRCLNHSLGYGKVGISLLRHTGCIILQSPEERQKAGTGHGDCGHHPHVLQEHNYFEHNGTQWFWSQLLSCSSYSITQIKLFICLTGYVQKKKKKNKKVFLNKWLEHFGNRSSSFKYEGTSVWCLVWKILAYLSNLSKHIVLSGYKRIATLWAPFIMSGNKWQ